MLPTTTGSSYLPFAPPLIGQDEIDEVVDTLRSDWITTGPKVKRFEGEFARMLGAPGALGVNSCTAALHTALVALGVGPGDEVITTAMTFTATVNVIEHVGARPVLVDVQPDTLNLDPGAVADAITPRTRAIVPVHYAGHPADLDALHSIARAANVPMLEDAAHALPARYRGRAIGAGDNPVAFSFYATKNMTTGEGGMLTGDPAFLERARVISLHGMNRDAWQRYGEGGHWYYEVVLPGFKYNMMDIQAALGLQQLRRLPDFYRRRCEIVGMYQSAFAGHDALEVPTERPEVEHAWHLYPLRIRPEALTIDRDAVIAALTLQRIGVSVHFIPIHLHPYYRDKYGYMPDDFPVAYAQYGRLVSLPLYPRMGGADVTRVIEAVLGIVRAHRR